MLKSRLNINGTDVGFISELPISINMAVADVREPDKRNSSYSKTISIPGTPEVIRLFQYIFQINATLTTFNPNLKTPASYYVNEVRVFNGGLQLLKIINKYQGAMYPATFECSIVGDTGNLFLDIAGLYLTDIDMSDLNHTFTYSSGHFNPTLGSGTCYPYIDYGINLLGVQNTTKWTFDHLKPAIFELEYVRRIFANAGYTWEPGGYFDSDYEKTIITPDVNEGPLKLAQSVIDANQFYAGLSSDVVVNTSGVYNGGFGEWQYTQTDIDPAPYDDDSTGSFYDPGNLYNTTTFIFAPAISAAYTLQSYINFEITINPPAGADAANCSGFSVVKYRIDYSTNGGASWTTSSLGSVLVSANGLSVTGQIITSVTSNINPGNIFKVIIYDVFPRWQIYDSGLTPITVGTSSADFTIKSGSYFIGSIASPNIQYGGLVDMNNTIPREVTQLNFLTSIIKSENLYIELDKLNPTNYVIETREDFIIETDPLDWTDKWDVGKDQEVVPMGDLDAKTYRFTYKADKDYFNTRYEDETKEIYGVEIIDVENDFIKSEKKIELIFSPTPISGTSSNDIVAPRLFKSDNDPSTSVKPLKCNIRRLIWGGLKNCQSHTFTVNGVDSTVTQYPFCGHVDDPYTPTVDLCFDNPQILYWNLPAAIYTDNNRYNERYSKFIQEATDPESKIVKIYLLLNEQDISQFSFRRIVFVYDAYYFVNKIQDYDPQVRKSVFVELLKLKKGAVFTPDSFAPSARGISTFNNEFNISGNYSNSNGKSVGQNNINNGTNSFITGDNNLIG